MEASPTLRGMFEQALALPMAERARFLVDQCPDSALRDELECLLAADASDAACVADGDALGAAQAIGDADLIEPLPPGSRIGPFELLEVLGEGGSSTVFRAVREVDGVRQQVALKLLARGLYTATARRRFHHEREALARLRHPGIARLIEGGVADHGLAYIALELVEGEPITRHAEAHQLAERQRLTLFLKVCRAVAAAHRALIVHRDLKPSNVLVTAEGDVRLLDFGIARLLDDEDATRTQQHALTPAYAAPEQFAGAPVGTAADVYALGVLLRELLGDDPRHAAPRVVGDTEGNAPRPGAGKLRGDLAAIAAKASAREPEQRYESVGAMAEDIERYLDRLPVRARPPSRWYRAGRFVARHRGGVVVTAALLLATFASLSIAVWQARVARVQAEAAREQAAHAGMVRDFVESLFAPLRYGDSATTRPSLEDLLARGDARLDGATQLGPAERVDLLAMFSRLYESIGDIAQARQLAGKAVALASRSLDPDDRVAIRALTARGYAEARGEGFAAAGADLRLAHARMRAQGVHGEDLIDLLGPLAAVETSEGHAAAALQLAREELAERIATWGKDDPRVGVGYNDVASALEGLERYPEASRMWQQTHAFDLAHFGAGSDQTTQALSGWASAEWRSGAWRHAQVLFAQVLADYARHGRPAQLTRVYATQKACVLDGMLGADTAATASACSLAQQLSAKGFGAGTPLHGDSLETSAIGFIEAGDWTGARALLARARKLYGNDPANRMRVGRVDSEVAGMDLQQGQAAQARALLPAAITGLRTRPYKMPPLLAEARLALACREAPGAECPRDLPGTLAHDRAAVADRHDPTLLWVDTLMAEAELHTGDAGAARARLAAAIAAAQPELPPAHPRLLAAGLWLAAAEAHAGDCAAAQAQAQAVEKTIVAGKLGGHPLLAGITTSLRKPAGSCPAPLP